MSILSFARRHGKKMAKGENILRISSSQQDNTENRDYHYSSGNFRREKYSWLKL